MKKRFFLFVTLLCAINTFTQASFTVDFGASVKSGSVYTFPDLTVNGLAGDRGYVVRIMFTRAVTNSDAINLPTVAGFTPHANSTQHVRVVNITAGATTGELQAYLRAVTFSLDASKHGHGIMILISENAVDAGRSVYYSSDTKNWYELIDNVSNISWINAYNASLDKEFLGVKGYLVTVTSAAENNFLASLVSQNTWMAGTRWNISDHVDAVTGKITSTPNMSSDLLTYWYWAAGPEWKENGKDPTKSVYYNKMTHNSTATSGITVKYPFTKWATNEPNNSNTEYCTHFLANGNWNDYSNTQAVRYYIVEFSGIDAGSLGLMGFSSSKSAAINGVTGNGTSDTPLPLLYSDVLRYSITAVNASETNPSVVVIDEVPEGLVVNTGSISHGGVYNSSTREITWNQVAVTPQGSTVVSFEATKEAGAINQMRNSAVVTSLTRATEMLTNSTYHVGVLCDVTFASGTNGDITDGTPQSVDYTLSAVAGVTPVPDAGYEFDYWSYPAYTSLKGVSQPGGNVSDYSTVSVLGHIVFTANFKVVNYDITYTLNDGTEPGNPATYNITQLPLTLLDPTRTGYDFLGWTGSNGDAPVTGLEIPAAKTGDLNYTANWKKITYKITYDGAGGVIPSEDPTAYDIESGDIILTNPVRPGYTFLGWTGSNGMTQQQTVTIATGSTGDKNFIANWQIDIYTITYNLDGGSDPSNPPTYTIEDTPLTISGQPTKAGYDFAGWTSDDDPTPQTTVTLLEGTTGNKTFTANWDIITYSISYIANGGILDAANPVDYTVESAPIVLVAPTRSGYDFTGWTGDNGATPDPNITIATGSTGDRTYEANWQVITYNITYNYAGGTAPVTLNPSNYTIEDTPFPFSNEPTRSGYRFAGWTGSNGLTPQTTVTVLEGTVSDLSYTANWTEDDYLISYNYNGGIAPAVDNKSSYKITDTPFEIKNEPTSPGYTFTGWTGSNGSTPEITVSLPKNDTGDKSYMANWTPINYTINYIYHGGTTLSPNPTNYDIETPTITLDVPVRRGFTFAGWAVTSSEAAVTVPTGVTIPKGTYGNLTCEALWTRDVFTIRYDYARGVGSTSANPVRYHVEELPITLNPPTRIGYEFIDWIITSDTTGVTVPNGMTIPAGTYGNLSCIARWNKLYSVFYDRDLGTSGLEPADDNWYDLNDYVTVLGNVESPKMALADACFIGWSFLPQSAVVTGVALLPADLILPGATFQIVADTVLYAVWGEDKTGPNGVPDGIPDYLQFKVLYEGNSHTGGYVPVDIRNYDLNDVATLLGNTGFLERTDACFIGWSETPSPLVTMPSDEPADLRQGGDPVSITGNRTFHAVWALDISGPDGIPDGIADYLQYQVVYVGSNLTYGPVHIDPNLYQIGDIVTVLENNGIFTRANACFIGWSYSSHNLITTESAIPSDLVTGGATFQITAATTFYAVWAEDLYGPDGVSDGVPDFYQTRLTYHENSAYLAAGGSLPAPNPVMYLKNTSATIKGNTGILTHAPVGGDPVVFAGWTATDGWGIVTNAASKPADMLMDGDVLPVGTTDIELYVVWAYDHNGDGVPDYNEPHVSLDPLHKWTENDPSDPSKPNWNPSNDLIGGAAMYASCDMCFVINVDPDPFRDRVITLNYLGALTKELVVDQDGKPLADSYILPKGLSTFTIYFSMTNIDGALEGLQGALEAVIEGGGRDTSTWVSLYNHPAYDAIWVSQYVDITGRINLGVTGGTPHLMRSINGYAWMNAYGPLTEMERLSIDDGVSIRLREPGGCWEAQLFFASYTNPDIQRIVTLASFPGVSTNPEAGEHYVPGHQDFVFTASFAGGNPLKVMALGYYTGISRELIGTKLEDGLYEYVLRMVTEPWSINFSAEPASGETGEISPAENLSVWSFNNTLHIRSTIRTSVYIYDMRGVLYKRMDVTEGDHKEVMLPGIYLVLSGQKRYTVIIK